MNTDSQTASFALSLLPLLAPVKRFLFARLVPFP